MHYRHTGVKHRARYLAYASAEVKVFGMDIIRMSRLPASINVEIG